MPPLPLLNTFKILVQYAQQAVRIGASVIANLEPAFPLRRADDFGAHTAHRAGRAFSGLKHRSILSLGESRQNDRVVQR